MKTEKRLVNASDWNSFYVDIGNNYNTMDSYDMGYTDALDRVDDWMDSQPTVDAVEVVHGRWEPRSDVIGFVRCSVCHDCNIYDDWPDGKKWNYCPNCGAKMDGGADCGNL